MAISLFNVRSICKVRFLLNELRLSKKYISDDSATKNNLYEILGITSSATQNEIKKAYYDLTFKYHPDKNESCNIAATKFREVTEAYEILGNYRLRKKYDRGVPLSVMKKAVKPIIIHKAKYQEFFDSRTLKKSQSAQDEDIYKLSSHTPKVSKEEKTNEVVTENLNTVQTVFAVFFCILLFLFR